MEVGFKGASRYAIDFVADQPKTLWSRWRRTNTDSTPTVNPEVDHPRLSQKTERVIGGGFLPGDKRR